MKSLLPSGPPKQQFVRFTPCVPDTIRARRTLSEDSGGRRRNFLRQWQDRRVPQCQNSERRARLYSWIGLYTIVKFVSVLIFSIFVINFIGRRRSLHARYYPPNPYSVIRWRIPWCHQRRNASSDQGQRERHSSQQGQYRRHLHPRCSLVDRLVLDPIPGLSRSLPHPHPLAQRLDLDSFPLAVLL